MSPPAAAGRLAAVRAKVAALEAGGRAESGRLPFGAPEVDAALGGGLPLGRWHEIGAEGLEAEYPSHLRHLAAFDSGEASDLRMKLAELLALPGPDRTAITEAARRAAVERWSWKSVADRLLALGVS